MINESTFARIHSKAVIVMISYANKNVIKNCAIVITLNLFVFWVALYGNHGPSNLYRFP